jgi:hypothetical protein
VSKCEQDGLFGHMSEEAWNERFAGQKGCERGDLNPHALAGTGS